MRSYWETIVKGIRYAIAISDDRVCLTKDTGNKETSGASEVPFPRFLRSRRLHNHVAEIHGEFALKELIAACEAALTSRPHS